jgi:hypothetical protein
MPQNPESPETLSCSNYQAIFDNALEAYKKKTKKDPASDPLLRSFEACDSPDAVLVVLREQIPNFDQSRSGRDRLSNWLNPTVNVLYNFSSKIGAVVHLVGFKTVNPESCALISFL